MIKKLDNDAEFQEFVLRCKKNVAKMATNGGCFIGSAFSCIDVLAYLYCNFFDVKKIKNNEKDRDLFILSKGHAVAGLYSVLAELDIFPKKRLDNYLSVDDDLYWHPNTNIPGIEFHSGSMGHGLSIGVGMAFASKIRNSNNRVVVLVGDGELNEGSIWESVLIASAYKLDNLIVVIDRNFHQANVKTEELIQLEPLDHKFSSFGWQTFSCDGNNFNELNKTFSQIKDDKSNKPKAIIAKTVRGKGISYMEDNSQYWFANLEKEKVNQLIDELNSLPYNTK